MYEQSMQHLHTGQLQGGGHVTEEDRSFEVNALGVYAAEISVLSSYFCAVFESLKSF